MLALERRKILMEILSKQGSVSVEEMAKKFHVTTMTIRRDLKFISELGNISRCYGGAILEKEVDYMEKRTTNHLVKEKIAKRASELISQGVVFLDAGTTTYELAKKISNTMVSSVVTNDLNIAFYLSRSNQKVTICGGDIQNNTGCIVGFQSLKMIKSFKMDIGFFGAPCIDDNFKAYGPTGEKAFFKREAMKQCLKTCLLVDSSKFHQNALNYIADLEEFDYIITDYVLSERDRYLLKGRKIAILHV